MLLKLISAATARQHVAQRDRQGRAGPCEIWWCWPVQRMRTVDEFDEESRSQTVVVDQKKVENLATSELYFAPIGWLIDL